jgi:hypothetical protein
VSLWESRDYPVLLALAVSDDNDLLHGFLQLGGGQAGERLGLQLSDEEIYTSVLVLGDADYLMGEMNPETGNNAFFTKLCVTGSAQQALGEWPLFGDPSPRRSPHSSSSSRTRLRRQRKQRTHAGLPAS